MSKLWGTGDAVLDRLLAGGLPKQGLIEIRDGSSKPRAHVLAQAWLAAVQRQEPDAVVAVIDCAQRWSGTAFARELNGNPARCLVAQPETATRALEVAEALLRSCAVQAIAVLGLEQSKGLENLTPALATLQDLSTKHGCAVAFAGTQREALRVLTRFATAVLSLKAQPDSHSDLVRIQVLKHPVLDLHEVGAASVRLRAKDRACITSLTEPS